MQHEHYIGGLTLIQSAEKSNEVVSYDDSGMPVIRERQDLVFVPYVKVETRVAYFWRLMELRAWHGQILPVQPQGGEGLGLPPGYFRYAATKPDGKVVNFIGCSMQARVWEPSRTVSEPIPVMTPPPGSKIVAAATRWDVDANALMRAETGAVGRALGMAGMLVAPGSGVACLPERAEILTRVGWLNHWQLAIGDEVAAYDVARDEVRWTPLRAVNVYQRAENIVRLWNKSFDVACTDDHKWAVQAKYDGAGGLRETHDLARGGPRLVLAARAEDGGSALSARDAAILGWLFTDGCVYWADDPRNSAAPYQRAVITQSKQDHVRELRALLGADAPESIQPQRVGSANGYVTTLLPRSTFRLRTAFTRALFARAEISGVSDLPALVARLSAPARAAMLDAMEKADGHTRGGGFLFVKDRRKRAVWDAFHALCALEGRALAAPEANERTQAMRQRVRSSRFVDAVKLRIMPEAPQPVWCPTTDLGTWVARLDEQPFITGNSAEDMLELDGPPPGAAPEQAQLPVEPEQPSDEQLRTRAATLVEQLREQSPKALEEFHAWAQGRKLTLADAQGAVLRGVVRKLESTIEAARA